ncbi:amidohydrolase family protein [Peribacillus butanolivorans]|uniref:amidohydrolase family protein n=1 Tax=Peribacillus butanolivorans TaxID=421767 RepID=UPI0020D221EC|nr:amidohydrolase family protein [Peribacillus butanolivorans]
MIGPEQRITPLEALRAVTSDAAWQNFEENEKGSIEKGKFADFVVLEENPLTIDPIKIKEIKVLKTIVNDKVIYEN